MSTLTQTDRTDTVSLQLKISKTLHVNIRVRAAQEGLPVSELVRRVLEGSFATKRAIKN